MAGRSAIKSMFCIIKIAILWEEDICV
jgi:hypothetical protein